MDPSECTFVPFIVTPDYSFWRELVRKKIETGSAPKTIEVLAELSISEFELGPCRVFLNEKTCKGIISGLSTKGYLIVYNSEASLKQAEKRAIQQEYGQKMWSSITNSNWLNNPESLSEFVTLAFIDPVQKNVIYTSCFNALQFPSSINSQELRNTQDHSKMMDYFSQKHPLAFLQKNSEFFELSNLEKFKNPEDVEIIMPDFSPTEDPCWSIRNFIAAVSYTKKWEHCHITLLKKHSSKRVRFAWRNDGMGSEVPPVTGWERSINIRNFAQPTTSTRGEVFDFIRQFRKFPYADYQGIDREERVSRRNKSMRTFLRDCIAPNTSTVLLPKSRGTAVFTSRKKSCDNIFCTSTSTVYEKRGHCLFGYYTAPRDSLQPYFACRHNYHDNCVPRVCMRCGPAGIELQQRSMD